jgi:hypothetical protein
VFSLTTYICPLLIAACARTLVLRLLFEHDILAEAAHYCCPSSGLEGGAGAC